MKSKIPTLTFRIIVPNKCNSDSKNQNKIFMPVGMPSEFYELYFNDRNIDIKFAEKVRSHYNNYTLNKLEEPYSSFVFFESSNYTYVNGFFNFFEIHQNDNIGSFDSAKNKEFDYTKYYYSEDDKSYKNQPVVNTFISKLMHKYPCPSIDEDGFYYEKDTWKMLVRNIAKHKNTLLTGPTGTGKTDIIMRICKKMNLKCHVYDMGQMMDPITDLLGSHRLENGSSIFDYARFVTDVQEPGVIILDELSRAPMQANNILFPCLDSRRCLPVDIADSKNDRIIKVHPECVFIATANIGTEYSGTNDIDLALENRFNIIQMDYMPANIEAKVLTKRTGISIETSMKLSNIISQIRNLYFDEKISKTVSTREALECAELVSDGFYLSDAIMSIVLDKFNKKSDDYNLVKTEIMGY